MNNELKKELRQMVTEDIPFNSSGKVDANAHRIQQSRNLKSVILLLLDNIVQLDSHVEENKVQFEQGSLQFKKIYRVIIAMTVVFAVTLVGLVAGWTIAGSVTVLGSLLKGAFMVFGKS